MIMLYLWKHRARAKTFSRTWVKLWVKRVWNAPALLVLTFHRVAYRWRGVRLGAMADIAGATLQGGGALLSVGNGSFVGRAQIQLLAEVVIGDKATINDGVRILTGSHDVDSPSFASSQGRVTIGSSAWICTNALILPGISVGKAAVVAAGAVVTRDVPDRAVVAGNPAKIVKMRGIEELTCAPNMLRACYEAWLGNVSRPG